MRVGVLYESDEWSDHKLAAELTEALGFPVEEINMMDADAVGRALACDLLISRVFASAQFRGHQQAHAHMDELITKLDGTGIQMLNPPRAHAFEVNKVHASDALAQAGVAVPKTFAVGHPANLNFQHIPYPVIIKPVCGGRTTCTCIAHTPAEAQAFLESAPDIPFLAQEYIKPDRGYLTRIEIVAHEPRLIVKRSVAENGLSAYHLGSTYELYPDCSPFVLYAATRAASALGFFFGSFDVIECARGAFFIDANSVSNVSEDCTKTFGMDLMRTYAQAIAEHI